MEQGILRSEGEAGAERRNSAEKLNLGGKDVVAGVDAPRDGPPLKVVESSNTEDPIAEGIHQSPGKPCDLGGMSPEPNLFDKGVFLSHKVASPAGNCNSTGTSAYKEFPTSQEVDWCPLRGLDCGATRGEYSQPVGYVPPADGKYKKIVIGSQTFLEGGTFFLSETGAYLLGLRG